MIGSVVVPILVISVLVAVNGVFVAAEFALVGSRSSRLSTLAEGGNRAAGWLVAVLERPAGKDGYIAVAQLGITLASIGLGMYGEPAVAHWLYDPFENWGLSNAAAHTVGFVVALSGITFMHVVFGEMIPKALALQAPEAVSLRVSPVMRFFSTAFRPLVIVLNSLAFALMRLLRIPEPDTRLLLYTSAELAIVTDESAHSGQLGVMQRDLIHNVFELDERTAEELMTPRGRVETMSIDTSAAEVESRIRSSPISRFPVIDGSIDRVVGVLHVKDFIRARQRGTSDAAAELLRPVPSVAGSASAERVLQLFRSQHTHAAVVVDEFGGTLGWLTLDDIIAEVMDAEIQTAADATVVHEDGSIGLDGEMTLADLRDHHGVDFVNPEVTTLAGIVLDANTVLPGIGTKVQVQGHELIVEEMKGRKITRVRLRPSPP